MNLPEPIGQAALAFFQRLLGPVGEASEFLSDKIRFYRWQSSLKTMKRAQGLAEKYNLKVKEVPLKFLIPFMEKSSLEEEDSDLINAWAMLLAQASNADDKAKVSYIDILSRLTSKEVKLLEAMISLSVVDDLKQTSGFRKRNNVGETCLVVNTGKRLGITSALIDYLSEVRGKNENIYDILLPGLYEFCERQRGGFVVEQTLLRFPEPMDDHTGIYASNSVVYSDMSSYDILISCGLLVRSQTDVLHETGNVTLIALFPTPLAFEFVMTCRGDDLIKRPQQDGP